MLLLTASLDAVGQVAELQNKYIASITNATSFTANTWYVIYTSSGRNGNYLYANGNQLLSGAPATIAVDQKVDARTLFKASGKVILQNGNGQYIYMNNTNVSISNSSTQLTYSNNNLYYKSGRTTYYLKSDGTATTSQYQAGTFYLAEVTFKTKTTKSITYNYLFNNENVGTETKTSVAQDDPFPTPTYPTGYELKEGETLPATVTQQIWNAGSYSINVQKKKKSFTYIYKEGTTEIHRQNTDYLVLDENFPDYAQWIPIGYEHVSHTVPATVTTDNYNTTEYTVNVKKIQKSFSYIFKDYRDNNNPVGTVQYFTLTIGSNFPTPILSNAGAKYEEVRHTYPASLTEANWDTETNNKQYEVIVAQPLPQTITYKGSGNSVTPENTLSLPNLISNPNANAEYIFTITSDDALGCRIDGNNFVAGKETGTVTVSAVAKPYGKSTAPDTWYAQSNTLTLTISIAVTDPDIIAFVEAYDNIKALQNNIGSQLGQYTFHYDQYDNNTVIEALAYYAQTYSNPASATKSVLIEAKNQLTDLYNAINHKDDGGNYVYLHLNLPADGSLIRIRQADDKKYLSTKADNTVEAITATAPVSAETIFYYYKKDGETNHLLLSYAHGFHLTSATTLGDAADHVITQANPNALDGLYTISGIGNFLLEDVAQLPVTITSHKWATLYTPTPVQIPNNLTAYVETDDKPTANKLPVARIIGTVPEGTALILNAEAGTYNFRVLPRQQGLACPNKLLTGTYPKIETSSVQGSGTVVALQPNTTTGTGFYKWTQTYITHFKAYYNTTSTQAAKGFILDFTGDTTATPTIESALSPAPTRIYTIQGHYVGTNLQSLPHGLYIIDGKKVVK